jgi:hypothetical protein
MMRIDVREQVRRAIRSEWQGFATSHPRLAAVVDETLLVQGAMEALSEDQEYREAMAQARVHQLAADAVAGLVERVVRSWLRTIV